MRGGPLPLTPGGPHPLTPSPIKGEGELFQSDLTLPYQSPSSTPLPLWERGASPSERGEGLRGVLPA